jgi:rod shape-determining protein MreB
VVGQAPVIYEASLRDNVSLWDPEVPDAWIRDAIDEVVKQMVDSVIRCLAVAPPELSQDFLTRGMFLVGGGSMLRGLAQRIERDTKVPVVMSDQPLEAVVLGAGHCIENFQALRGMFMDARK